MLTSGWAESPEGLPKVPFGNCCGRSFDRLNTLSDAQPKSTKGIRK